MRHSSYAKIAVKPQSAVSLSGVLFSYVLIFRGSIFLIRDAICLAMDRTSRTNPNNAERCSGKFGSVRPSRQKAAEHCRISPNIGRMSPNKAERLTRPYGHEPR
jgi:hypothetical protein